jgi:hypothetical protein
LQIRNIARVSTALLLSFVTTSGVSAQETKAMSAQELNERTVQRRAVEAVIWGIPVGNNDRMYQAMVSAANDSFNQILY